MVYFYLNNYITKTIIIKYLSINIYLNIITPTLLFTFTSI